MIACVRLNRELIYQWAVDKQCSDPQQRHPTGSQRIITSIITTTTLVDEEAAAY